MQPRLMRIWSGGIQPVRCTVSWHHPERYPCDRSTPSIWQSLLGHRAELGKKPRLITKIKNNNNGFIYLMA